MFRTSRAFSGGPKFCSSKHFSLSRKGTTFGTHIYVPNFACFFRYVDIVCLAAMRCERLASPFERCQTWVMHQGVRAALQVFASGCDLRPMFPVKVGLQVPGVCCTVLCLRGSSSPLPWPGICLQASRATTRAVPTTAIAKRVQCAGRCKRRERGPTGRSPQNPQGMKSD